MKRKVLPAVIICLAVLLWAGTALAAGGDGMDLGQAGSALSAAVKRLEAPQGSKVLLLTNAGYGQMNGKSTQAFVQLALRQPGLSLDCRSLLTVHSSWSHPLWFALYSKKSGRLIYSRWQKDGFALQSIDARPQAILTPAGWKKAATGPIGPGLFGVVSLSLSWAKGANWPLLLAGSFHNHFCPGLNAGYLAAVYLRQHLPLGKGQRYVFIGAPPNCAMDALQVLTDATPGKSGSYSLLVKGDLAAKYFPKGVGPLVIAARIEGKADKCQGVVLGIAWDKLCQDMGLDRKDMSPPGGKSNPLFFISRAKLSLGLAGMPLKKKMSYVIKVKDFSGRASLAERIITAGPDPYSLVMSP